MKRLLGLNGESPSPSIARAFEGVGLIRGEYLCRRAGTWITTSACRSAIQRYLEDVAGLFAPRPVWYRLIDMESREASTFPGCEAHFEEKTTLLGMRGVRRGLAVRGELVLELAAVAIVARKHGNLHLLIPFVSDAREVAEIVPIARQAGFPNRIGAMVETPAAVLTLSDLVDSGAQELVLGLNDLASLTLGTARESPFYRRDHAAILTLVRHAVQCAHSSRVPLHAAGYLSRDDLVRLASCGIESTVIHYSLLAQLWPEEFTGLRDALDLTAIKNEARAKVHDPLIPK
jgi:phosphoenolpyruvate-protein kinase (PTS system EI component)